MEEPSNEGKKGDRKAVSSNYTARFIIYRQQFLLARGAASSVRLAGDRSMICAAASRIRRRSMDRHRSPVSLSSEFPVAWRASGFEKNWMASREPCPLYVPFAWNTREPRSSNEAPTNFYPRPVTSFRGSQRATFPPRAQSALCPLGRLIRFLTFSDIQLPRHKVLRPNGAGPAAKT